MKILLIDCITRQVNVSLKIDNKLYSYKGNFTKSSSIISAYLQRILIDTNTKSKDIDFIVLPNGGGSFSGIRIAYSLAFGISCPYDIPIIQVNPLDCFGKKFCYLDNLIIPIIDSKKQSVWTACYQKGDLVAEYKDMLLVDFEKNLKKEDFVCGYDYHLTNHKNKLSDTNIQNQYFEIGSLKFENKDFGDAYPKYLRDAL